MSNDALNLFQGKLNRYLVLHAFPVVQQRSCVKLKERSNEHACALPVSQLTQINPYSVGFQHISNYSSVFHDVFGRIHEKTRYHHIPGIWANTCWSVNTVRHQISKQTDMFLGPIDLHKVASHHGEVGSGRDISWRHIWDPDRSELRCWRGMIREVMNPREYLILLRMLCPTSEGKSLYRRPYNNKLPFPTDSEWNVTRGAEEVIKELFETDEVV